MPIRRMLALLGLAFTAACTEGNEVEARVWTERDSAGITIVENRWEPVALQEGWRLEADPELVLGRLDGPPELQLFNVRGAARLTDGRIVVVDGGSNEIRTFAADGAFLARHGGPGEGPGEFTAPSLAGLRGDSLVVYDGAQRRVTIMHPDDGFVRSYPVGGEGGGYPVEQGMFADGTINFGGGMFFSSSDGGFPTGRVRPPSPFVAIAPDGSERSTYGEFPGGELFARVSDRGMSAVGLPYGRFTVAATGREILWIGTQDAWEIRGFAADGSPRRIVRMAVPARPVTPALREEWLEEQLRDAADENARRSTMDTYRDVPSGDVVPPYGPLAVDALNHLWASDYPLPGDDAVGWTVFDPQGHAVGRVVLPPGRPLDIGEDWLLLHRRDELDVERLELLRFTRPAASSG